MNNIHDYQATIDILSKGFDATQIAYRLAKHHPAIFVEMFNMPESNDQPGWHNDVIKQIMAGNHVGSIKTIREHTGFGLKDAKDIMDNLINAMINVGYNLKGRENPGMILPESHTARALQALFNTSRTVKNYYV